MTFRRRLGIADSLPPVGQPNMKLELTANKIATSEDKDQIARSYFHNEKKCSTEHESNIQL